VESKIYPGRVYVFSGAKGNLILTLDTPSPKSPAAFGISVGVASTNDPPKTPSTISGPASGRAYASYNYSTSTIDPNGDRVKYTFNWGDGTTSTTDLVNSGVSVSASHKWTTAGIRFVKAYATDSKGAASRYSNAKTVTIAAGHQKKLNFMTGI